MKIAIFGAGGAGLDDTNTALLAHPDAEIVLIDDSLAGGDRYGIPIVPLASMRPGNRFVLGMASGHDRARLEGRCLRAGLKPLVLCAPSATVAIGASIADGAVLCGNTLVGHGAQIGRQFRLDWYSYVGHGCRVGDFVTFAPRVSCNGGVIIGDHVYIGTGAVIRQATDERPIVIGDGAIVGMGAVVTKSIPPGVTVVGNPARPLESKRLKAVV